MSTYQFSEEGFIFNRLLSKISINASHSSNNLTTEIKLINTSLPWPNLDYDLINNNSDIFFLSSFRKPTNLKINYNLHYSYLNEEFVQTVTIDYKIRNLDYSINYAFTFTVHNVTFDQLLASELNVLKYFRNELWRKNFLFTDVENTNLDIVSFKQIDDNSFRFVIGSSEGQSNRLSNLLSAIRNEKNCSSFKSDELGAFRGATDLNLDSCSIRFDRVENELKYDTDFTVNASFDIQISDPTYTKLIQETIIAVVILTNLIIAVVLIIFSIYKCFNSNKKSNESKKQSNV